MPNYDELKVQAEALQIPTEGLSKKELAKAIQAKTQESAVESSPTTSEETTESTPVVASSSDTPTEPAQESAAPEVTTALIVKKGVVIRTYSLEVHGTRFVELAQQFAKKFDVECQLVA